MTEPREDHEDTLDEQDRLAGAWEHDRAEPTTEDAEPHEDDPEEGTPG